MSEKNTNNKEKPKVLQTKYPPKIFQKLEEIKSEVGYASLSAVIPSSYYSYAQ